MTDTAPCTKCNSEISIEARRCPECGYEPSVSTLGKLFYWIFALPTTLILSLVGVVAVGGVILGSLTITEGIGGLVGIAILGALPCWYTLRVFKIKRTTATGEFIDE